MIYFIVAMMLLAIAALYRGPVLSRASVLWFFISWLPGELPWLFAAIQIAGITIFAVLSENFGLVEVCSLFLSVISFALWFGLHQKTRLAGPVLQAALRDGLGNNFESKLPLNIGIDSPPVIHKRDWLNPFGYRRHGVERLQDISYGDADRNTLDIYRSVEHAKGILGRPVLLHVHGGAWTIGHKYQQAQPLMKYLAQNGWICVDINYRLAPRNRYPECLIDVKKAIVWIKENIANYGGNPNFIAITGGSAGGHLCAMASLTANNPEYQPGFENCDTQVQAAVPIYGVYDFTHQNLKESIMHSFLEKYVMPKNFLKNPDSWKSASPLFQIRGSQVPVFVIHGDKDCVIPVEQSRDFVLELKKEVDVPVIYAELPGAQHGFDIFHSIRTEFHIEAVGKFLHYCYAKHLELKTKVH